MKSLPFASLPCQRPSRWLALSLALVALTIPMSARAQERLLRTLTVTGQGRESIAATLADVTLGVEVRESSATAVQAEVARRMNGVVNVLRSRNVEQLQTTGISLQPNYEYRNNQQRLVGYIGTSTVSYRTPSNEAGAVIDAAIQAGATRIDGIRLTASDSAISTAQKVALQAATQDAKAQADAVLAALNLSRQEIISISINSATPPTPRPLMQRAEAMAADATPIIGGEQDVQASVTLEIRY
ncbi:SIMPL domain-containing protein [Spirulina subsalsa FACHB-351]|uniref:SIMPL domain-containing protein n=1 Tax=Spirulina subsalsa FACHB-351 TaxID=234711 RepID=A0ABT3L6W9_9CYAN|nr:SIMPL domain-containing protein [Spirulina subsalsa]MCW6037261.1 SIMPL domain-containing protein [Spirulina subsalsa FACHB-351]